MLNLCAPADRSATPSMPLILRGDARSLPLPDDSVDLIVTSPPYFGLRSYTDGGKHCAGQLGDEATPAEFIAALVECTREMARVLKPTGSIFLNLGDKYNSSSSQHKGQGNSSTSRLNGGRDNLMRTDRPAIQSFPSKSLLLLPERYRIAAVDELGLIARAVLVWSKRTGVPESVTDRVRRSHEDWVHLTKAPRYFSAIDEIREPCITRKGAADYPLGRIPGSVWEIAIQPLKVPAELGVEHFAAFPMEWPRRLIKGWCPPDGVVLDPFGGTGTTALVATMLGRTGISVDLSADYCRLATWRASDSKQRARAA